MEHSVSIEDIQLVYMWITVIYCLAKNFRAHLLHILQNSHTPISISVSGTSSKSVKTFDSRAIWPNLGVINNQLRTNSPNPASIAIGMLHAASLPHGIALNSRSRSCSDKTSNRGRLGYPTGPLALSTLSVFLPWKIIDPVFGVALNKEP